MFENKETAMFEVENKETAMFEIQNSLQSSAITTEVCFSCILLTNNLHMEVICHNRNLITNSVNINRSTS